MMTAMDFGMNCTGIIICHVFIPEQENHTVGIWGRRHQQYLKDHYPMFYSDLILSGRLHSYLADIDTQAQVRLNLLIKQMAEKECIDEQLKARDQMAWVGAMNNIRNRAEEIVFQELIYGLEVMEK